MKAVILTQYFPPEIGAAQNRIMALAQALKSRDHEVTVLTALPNYPTGQIFPAYRHRQKRREVINGIQVIRSWLFVHKSRGTFATLLSYLTFAFASLRAGKRKIKNADLLIWEYPPPFLGYTALKLGRKWKAKIVTNMADLWTIMIQQHGILSSQFILSRFEKYESRILQSSVLVTGQTDGVLVNIKSRAPDLEPVLWPNGADLEHFSPRARKSDLHKKYNPQNHFIIGYAGLHGRNHNLRLLLDTAKYLKVENNFHFLFIGDGYEKRNLQLYADALHLPNVSFFDPIPHQDLPDVLALFDIGVVIHKNLPGLKVVRSAKLFEYMAMGIPILHCAESEGAEIVRKADAGLVVSEDDPHKVVEAILIMKNSKQLSAWGRNGHEFVRNNFDRQKLSLMIVEKIETALKLA